jgi:hypothetical protein
LFFINMAKKAFVPGTVPGNSNKKAFRFTGGTNGSLFKGHFSPLLNRK